MLRASNLYFLVGLVVAYCDVIQESCDLQATPKSVNSIQACLTDQRVGIDLDRTSVVSNGSHCRVTCLGDGNQLVMKCESGIWEFDPFPCTGEPGEVHVRNKRFWGFFVGAIIGLFGGRSRSRPPPDRSPPHVYCPPDIRRIADPIQTSTRIDWDESGAYAIDDRDGRISASRWSRKGPYYVFWGKTTVVYHARDSTGNNGHCNMKITVTTVRCSPGPSRTFRNGYYVCHPSTDFVYGTRCNYGCYYGYIIAGEKRRECLNSGRWSSAEPQCEVVTCPPLEPFSAGTFLCNSGYNFKSACSYTCKTGYDVAPGKSRVRVCGFDGQWRGSIPTCTDSEPPKFTDCPRVLTYFAERGSSSGLVDWVVPSVTDNSRQTITPTQTSGISNIEYHPSGVYDIVYEAIDAVGNEARPCKFKVVVKELKCFAQYPLPYMKVDCPSGYGYGASCDFSCDSGYGINGSDSAVCERSNTYPPYAYWKMTRPSCEALGTCPTLTPPDNGALACDLWEDGTFCQMQCMKGTDIPPSFDYWKLFVCNIHGAWNFDGNIPPCSKVRLTSRTRMTATMYYYEGSCPDADVMTTIKENFLLALQQSPFFTFINTEDMAVENVKVTCGAVREKRSTTSRMEIHCDIIGTMADPESKQAFKETERNSNDLLQMVKDDTEGDNSKLLPHLDPGALSTVGVDSTRVELDCPAGTLPSYIHTLGCAECTSGTYFTSGKCELCPIGSYQPLQGQTECVQCPSEKTTLRQGAEECLPKCQLGHFSANSVEPCTPCDLGEYADAMGAKKCKICPVAMTTAQQRSTGLASCKHFDLSLTDQTASVVELEVPVVSLDVRAGFGVRLWVRCLTETGGDIMILTSPDADMFSLKTDDQLQLQFSTSSTALNFHLEKDTWYQVQVNYDSAILTVHVDDSVVFQGEITETSWAIVDTLLVTIGGNGFQGSVSQVNMWRTPRAASTTNQRVCFTDEVGDILAWFNFTTSNMTEAFLQIPSECDDVDECQSGPCVHGECTNVLNNYTCTCDDGFRGRNCDVNINDCVDNQCINGGLCVDGESSYTCVCTPEHTGEFCDANLVHGGWGTWGNWTECSKTCGPGERTRVRRCDRPLPQDGGETCSGPDKEVGTCTEAACPVCSEPDLPSNSKLECKEEVGMKRCELVCDEGYDLDLEPLDLYECGQETGYQWNYITEDNPGGKLPNCMAIQPANELEMEYAADYVDLTCDRNLDDTQTIDNTVRQQADNMPCVLDNSCYIKDIRINNNCEGSRKKRNVVLANFIIILANSPSTLGTDTSLQYLSSALLQLNSTALAGNFTVTIGGNQYHISPSPDLSGQVTCQPGWARVNYYCVPCGPGTFYMNDYCQRCDIGRYSNITGATSCQSCPQGKVTPGRASISIEECTVDINKPGDTAGIVAAIVTPFLVVAVGLAAYLMYPCIKRHTKIGVSKKALKNPIGPVVEAWVESPKKVVLESSLPVRKMTPEVNYPAKIVPLETEPNTENLEPESGSLVEEASVEFPNEDVLESSLPVGKMTPEVNYPAKIVPLETEPSPQYLEPESRSSGHPSQDT